MPTSPGEPAAARRRSHVNGRRLGAPRAHLAAPTASCRLLEDSNALILPAKGAKAATGAEGAGGEAAAAGAEEAPPEKQLSKSQLRKLRKIQEEKEKRAKRADVLQTLAQHQVRRLLGGWLRDGQ